jgi:hypothetical protein
METRMKALLPVVTLVAALSLSCGASAQQPGTAAEAKLLLAKAAIAVKADKASALAKFDDPNGGFKDRDLYVFCFDLKSGTVLAGAPTTKGRDVRTFRDTTGKPFGQEMFTNVKDGEVIIEDYMFPKPNSTVPVAKESFVEGLGDVACGVGYYTPFAQAPPEWSRTAREQHACSVIMGLHQPGNLYNICVGSLAKSLSDQDKARQISTQRNACAQQGLKPGTPSFAACVETGPGF